LFQTITLNLTSLTDHDISSSILLPALKVADRTIQS